LFKSLVAKYEGPGQFVLGIMEYFDLIGDEGFREFIQNKLNNCQKLFQGYTKRGAE